MGVASVGWACVPGHDHGSGHTTVTSPVASEPAAPVAPVQTAEPPVTVLTMPVSEQAPAPAATTASAPEPAATTASPAAPRRPSTQASTSAAATTPAAPAADTPAPAPAVQAPAPAEVAPAPSPASSPVTGAGMWEGETTPASSTSDGGTQLAGLGLFAAGGALVLGGSAAVVRGRRSRRAPAVAHANHPSDLLG